MTEKAATEVGIREFKANLSAHVGRVMFGGEILFVMRNKKRAAVLVPVEWYERAEAALARESAES